VNVEGTPRDLHPILNIQYDERRLRLRIHAGKKTLSPEVSCELAEHATDDALTKAEIDVLRLIAAGNANKQIADRLSVTEETVKGRVRNLLSKLGANDRTRAAMIGLRRGIIEL
jgi:DNA-binding NarL/FixJ family response regulator